MEKIVSILLVALLINSCQKQEIKKPYRDSDLRIERANALDRANENLHNCRIIRVKDTAFKMRANAYLLVADSLNKVYMLGLDEYVNYEFEQLFGNID